MDEETWKKLLEAARTIRDFCERSDCGDCPFRRNLGRACWIASEDDCPAWWRIPDEQ